MPKYNLRKLLLYFIMLLVFSNNYAQNGNVSKSQIKYIPFNYLVDTPQSYSNLEDFGTLIGIKIENVNKKLIQINNSFIATSFHTAIPEAFQAFSKMKIPQATSSEANVAALAPETSYFTSNEIQSANAFGVKELEQINQKYSDLDEDLVYLDQRIENFLTYYTYVKNLTSYHRDILVISNLCNQSYRDINLAFIAKTKNLLTSDKAKLNEVLGISYVIDANKGDVITNRLILENYSTQVLENADASYADLINLFSTEHLKNLEAKIANLQKYAGEMLNYMTDHQLVKEEPGIIPKLNDLYNSNVLTNRLGDIIKFYNSFDFPKLHENLNFFKDTGMKAMFSDYDYFNEANYTYYSAFQTIDKDLVTFTIDLTSKEETDCPIVPKRYEVKIRSKKGLKIDFSTGVLFNFGGNDFLDQTYSYQNIEGTESVQIIKNDNKNFLFPSAGALMHIYTRNGTDFQPTLSFGVSTQEFSKLNYHLGSSLIFGFSQRVIISSGLTLGQTLLIEDGYKVGQILLKTAAPESIPTSNFNRIGYFFAFTYNLN